MAPVRGHTGQNSKQQHCLVGFGSLAVLQLPIQLLDGSSNCRDMHNVLPRIDMLCVAIEEVDSLCLEG